MKICVSAMSGAMDAKVSERFGRAPYFVIVESEGMSFTPVINAAESMQGGAGPEAVRQVAAHGAQVILTGDLGPNAKTAIEAAGIKGVTGISGVKTVRQAVEEYLKK
ncbi:MAG TPA: dinitrogenase iron-molybdenum cofactor biosynthesis protein [Elusimicrobia bacterium]|nr:dinitrogenase iron-molybdenum cofactor biosynthesis protein [Elusimicrobiota bacterium]